MQDLTLEEALTAILADLPAGVAESVPLLEAHGRVLAEAVLAPMDLPCFDNSAMDGYAVRARETAAASSESPARLRLAGSVAAGENFDREVPEGACVRIATGAPLPPGLDAAVMREDTRFEEGSGEVLVLEGVKPWENVRLRGGDVKAGSVLASAGERLSSGHLALLAASGVEKVTAGRQPRTALLATGSELREPGQPLAPGQIYECNRLMLAPLVSRCGGIPKIFPLVGDDLRATRQALEDAFSAADVVITTGGASVGELDYVKRALAEAGGAVRFWRVAIKPGRPFLYGRRQEKVLFGLPGNPVSAFVTFLLLARPALLRWQGATDTSLPGYPGVLAEPLRNPDQRRHYVRVRVQEEEKVFAAGLQSSHAVGALAHANGLVEVPPGTSWSAGAVVRVLRWD